MAKDRKAVRENKPPKGAAAESPIADPAKRTASRPETSSRRQVDGKPRPGNFAIVGIGASAGGLEAFRNFFTAMHDGSQMAFVLIQHLHPEHESLTAELLGRHTKLKVLEATDDTRVEPGHVYVIPPSKYLSISQETLRLSEPLERRGLRVPIDYFLRSLAEDQQERGIGVILTGAGTDGTLGVREIKAACGMVMVQAPETAQVDGMPRSAIGTGVVDYVLPIEEMPTVLSQYVQHWGVDRGIEPEETPKELPDGFGTILNLLRARTRYDFTAYRKGTLLRRIRRRMGLNHLGEMNDYVELLRREKNEVEALFKDLLISVTNFFREPEVWEAFSHEAIRPLVEMHDPQLPIRVWVPGCATGEEPYSIAMLLLEACQQADKGCNVVVFASDIDRDALEVGRVGVYPENIAADVSADRLRRFFGKVDHSYRVNRDLREMVVFAEQNALSDPPFSKVDIISCRNLLIYLEPEAQERLMTLFHFALRSGGVLCLGSGENIGRRQDLFEPISRKFRIFRRLGSSRQTALLTAQRSAPAEPPEKIAQALNRDTDRHLTALTQQLMLQRYAPAAALINRRLEVLCLSGPIDDYLQLPAGEMQADIIGMARPGLRTKLRAILHEAIESEQPAITDQAQTKRGSEYFSVRINVEPLRQPKEAAGLLLVTFAEGAQQSAHQLVSADSSIAVPMHREQDAATDYEPIVHHLDEQLRATRDELQSALEELETSNEEFKASNEEVMSINEELQSTNEELETSKEEMQSLNEELQTVNSQLEQKVGELESVNNDLTNLLASIDVPTIFLDRRLKLRRFTPATRRMLRVIDSDIGRSITDFARNFEDETMIFDSEEVLRDLAPREQEMRDKEGRWFVRRTVPYRTDDDRINGIVITFQDITRRVQDAEELKRLNEQLQHRVETTTKKAQVLEQEVAEVADQERQRLGRDLHDSLSQQITGMAMLATALRKGMPDNSPMARLAERLETSMQDAKESLRRLMKGVFPVDVDANGLQAALDTLARDTRESYGLVCDFECPTEVPLESNFTATQLFLMAREAVHNAVKHATPQRIVVRLESSAGAELKLSVIDDGDGISDKGRDAGMGLHIMQYRCNMLGGSLNVERSESGGTCVMCVVPQSRSSTARQ